MDVPTRQPQRCQDTNTARPSVPVSSRTRLAIGVGGVALLLAVASPALAQGEDDVTDIEVPTIILDDVGGTAYVDEPA